MLNDNEQVLDWREVEGEDGKMGRKPPAIPRMTD